MSEQPRKVKLTRAVEDGGRETFGFSVSGGAGSKLSVIVVWEVTPGLPAALSASVCNFLLYSYTMSLSLVLFLFLIVLVCAFNNRERLPCGITMLRNIVLTVCQHYPI